MVKGCEKRMIRLQNTGSRMFEEVYFVLREDLPGEGCETRDILAEANRIVEENEMPAHKRTGLRTVLLPFLIGAATATALVCLLFLVL